MKRLIKRSTHWLIGLVIGIALYATPEVAAMGLTKPVSVTCLPPSPPLISGSRPLLCRGQQTDLTASGCTGEVIWSTGERGTGIRVSPHQTTRYTAVCRLADGCVSCFANAFTVTVGTPDAPILHTDMPAVCAGDGVTISASHCDGTLTWTDLTLTGPSVVVHPAQTTTYQATCQQGTCTGAASTPLTIMVAPPAKPLLRVANGQSVVCAGQSITVEAEACLGQVRWSDGGTGTRRTFVANQSLRIRAVCRMGSCQSDSSLVLTVPVQPGRPALLAQTTVRNACPFQTADLTQAIGASFDKALTYEFRTSADINSPLLNAPGAVLAGTYYVSSKPDNGCSSLPVAVSALITACTNAISPCLSNPPMATLRLDTLDTQRGLVCLQAKLRGFDSSPLSWTCTGSGLMTNSEGLRPRYVASEADRKAGPVTFVLTTPDPDGTGPCTGATAKLTVDLTAPRSQTGVLPKSDTLHVISQPEASIVFIPEGFSPNDDGINDRFVIRDVPNGLTVQLEVFNRWGHRVYANADYKNDWDGTANQGIRTNDSAGLPDGTYFYVVKISDGREFVRFMTIAR
ncbi:gliding motility-associated C-terminal domain-containing protein [Fibrella sp. HMF5335]|uniref:Gliding motility-associated C-terminal domain-containing protein n=1 Tax=Fibrella rubiginis TaxID=2817060 RepID=A0A939GIV2_9BACT|nr:gliding motility-associated C-terminal domain-containing protein [Fibrella rubiginis]MBO0940017.1 gliding motility-associated C-terminal domain-containing protein [Fibrella rubiginis]